MRSIRDIAAPNAAIGRPTATYIASCVTKPQKPTALPMTTAEMISALPTLRTNSPHFRSMSLVHCSQAEATALRLSARPAPRSAARGGQTGDRLQPKGNPIATAMASSSTHPHAHRMIPNAISPMVLSRTPNIFMVLNDTLNCSNTYLRCIGTSSQRDDEGGSTTRAYGYTGMYPTIRYPRDRSTETL